MISKYDSELTFSLVAAQEIKVWADNNLIIDTEAPVITILGDNPLNYTVNDSYIEYGATAIDIRDGDVTNNIITDNSSIDMTTVGSYSVTYNVSDTAGNPAIEQSRTVLVSEESTGGTPIPIGGADGLWEGTTEAVGTHNTTVLMDNINSASDLNIIIPYNEGDSPVTTDGITLDGYWMTRETVYVDKNTTITFEGGLMQYPLMYPTEPVCFMVRWQDVTLYQPKLSQGRYYRTSAPGTNSVLVTHGNYNIGNLTVYGGIIEGGGSNCYQAARNNTTFHGTHFRDAREHVIYCSGRNGDGLNQDNPTTDDPDHFASDIIFNDCIIENPGNSDDAHESNHCQFRWVKNIQFNRCTIKGVPIQGDSQYAFLFTDCLGATINDTTANDYRAGIVYASNTDNVVFNRCDGISHSSAWAVRAGSGTGVQAVTFNDCSIKHTALHNPMQCKAETIFNNSRIDLESDSFHNITGANTVFNNMIWDFASSDTSLTTAFLEEGTSTFTGTSTIVCPDDAHNITLSPIPGSCDSTVITGLLPGRTEAIAIQNSATLQSAFNGNLGNLNLIIPANDAVDDADHPIDWSGNVLRGYWMTFINIDILANTTVTFLGGIMQSPDTPGWHESYNGDSTVYGKYVRTIDIAGGNVVLNQPKISQGGYVRTYASGTHGALGIYGSYNTGNIQINGGVIEGGGSNCLQGIRSNTTFNGTLFKNAREHVIYLSGGNGDGLNQDNPLTYDPAHFATGVHFINCTIENPGWEYIAGQYGDNHEANHFQMRNVNDVNVTDCIIRGEPETTDAQFGFLGTDITGFRATNTTVTGYQGGGVFLGTDFGNGNVGSSDWVFENVDFEPASYKGNAWAVKTNTTSTSAIFNNCLFKRVLTVYGTMTFNNSTIDIGSYRAASATGSNIIFNNTTWDIYDSTTSRVFDSTNGIVNITGTTTRICHKDGNVFNWDIIPGTCP